MTEREEFEIEWKRLGELLVTIYGRTPGLLASFVKVHLPRIAQRMPGIGIAVPCAPGRSVVQETLQAVAGMACDLGLLPQTVQGFEIASNREWLLNRFIEGGFRQLLFLDSDTVIEERGLFQLIKTMREHDAAMVSTLVFQRFIGAEGTYNAFREGGEGEPAHVALTRADLPSTLVAFPVSYCGLAAALLDLEKIKAHEGPRFRRRIDGDKQYNEDISFCDWLRERDLTFVVDPKVATLHCVQHRFAYMPPEVKE